MKPEITANINKVNFVPVVTKEDIKEVAAAATEIWHEHFITILNREQIDYMVDKFQSGPAIASQLKIGGYGYYMIMLEENLAGYFAVKEEAHDKSLFLSKLYLRREYRGNGIASLAFAFMTDLCRQKGYKKIWLTVNRFNKNTITVYEKKGFVKTRTQVTDIGSGFVMDDYVMEMQIV